jgi:[ribosomal protein S5]-alanine N-acetyltransferase
MTRIVLPGAPLVDGPTFLRPWRDSDVAAVTAACQDPDIVRWTRVPDNYTESDARAFLLYRHDAVLAGVDAPFAVVSADDRLLGSVALMGIEWPDLRAEVGYWLAREARGQGHATRAVRLISAWGFRVLGLERIALHAASDNRASQRVAERSGYTREAVLRAYFRGKQGQEDMVAFGLLADEHGGDESQPG